MDRRVLFTGLGAVVAGTALNARAFAQAPSMSMGLGPTEQSYVKQTLMVGSLSLLASRMAVTMAKARKVLEFAKFEVAEQETVADILTGMMKPMSQAMGMVMPPTDDQAKANIDQDGMAKLTMLMGMTGTAFDTAYVELEVDGHQKLLGIQNGYLAMGKMREGLDVAKLAKGMITEHLQLLSDIQKMKTKGHAAAG